MGYCHECQVPGSRLAFLSISHGNVSASIVGTREVFMRLMLCGASQFVMGRQSSYR